MCVMLTRVSKASVKLVCGVSDDSGASEERGNKLRGAKHHESVLICRCQGIWPPRDAWARGVRGTNRARARVLGNCCLRRDISVTNEYGG